VEHSQGVYEAGEEPLAAARREFAEETGGRLDGQAVALGSFRQSTAKTVDAWAVEGDFDPAGLKSNTFAMEWPPRSGRMGDFPEVDRAEWFTPAQAARKILKGQRLILQALLLRLGESGIAPT
jgi:predicted NUDIX family NTP pyrophosphohydrolase